LDRDLRGRGQALTTFPECHGVSDKPMPETPLFPRERYAKY
jgi:hypothetical protein